MRPYHAPRSQPCLAVNYFGGMILSVTWMGVALRNYCCGTIFRNNHLNDESHVMTSTPIIQNESSMTNIVALHLTDKDQAMLHGDFGPATQMAMRILTRMAEVAGAKELLSIEGAHIDSTVFIGDAGLEYAEKLASLGARVSVPTTLNVSGVDEHHWR